MNKHSKNTDLKYRVLSKIEISGNTPLNPPYSCPSLIFLTSCTLCIRLQPEVDHDPVVGVQDEIGAMGPAAVAAPVHCHAALRMRRAPGLHLFKMAAAEEGKN